MQCGPDRIAAHCYTSVLHVRARKGAHQIAPTALTGHRDTGPVAATSARPYTNDVLSLFEWHATTAPCMHPAAVALVVACQDSPSQPQWRGVSQGLLPPQPPESVVTARYSHLQAQTKLNGGQNCVHGVCAVWATDRQYLCTTCQLRVGCFGTNARSTSHNRDGQRTRCTLPIVQLLSN